VRDDRRVFAEGWLRPPVAMREQLAEFVDRVDRIEADDAGVCTDPGTRVDATRPVFQVTALERLELLALDTCLGDDLVERNMVALAVPSKACDEAVLRRHLSLHVIAETPAITAPVSGAARYNASA
jgi:hypothetical protein